MEGKGSERHEFLLREEMNLTKFMKRNPSPILGKITKFYAAMI